MKLTNSIGGLVLGVIALFAISVVSAAAPTPASVPVAMPVVASEPPENVYDPTKPEISVPAVPKESKPETDAIPAVATKAFLWEVKSKVNVMYLFGTIHVGKRSFYPLQPQVQDALNASQRLVVEANISNNEGMGDIARIINYKAPDNLEKHIPVALFNRLKIQLMRLRLPLEAVRPMKPYLIGGFLTIVEFSKLGYDMNLGVDGYLIAKSKDDNRPVLELESQIAQLKMMDGMPPQLQEAFLENAISTLESGNAPDQVTGMVNAWQTGDVTLMQEVSKSVNKGMRLTDQLDAVLLYSRHDAMMKKIVSYLDGDVTHFVAVGSLHLLGPKGLVEMLKARGYEVKQL
ncbi:MAG: TraB/GumN family protein [Betaproteobacteria bacterium]